MRLLKCSSSDDKFSPPTRKLCDNWHLSVCLLDFYQNLSVLNIFFIWSKAQRQGALIIEKPMPFYTTGTQYSILALTVNRNRSKRAAWRRSALSKCFFSLENKFDFLFFLPNPHVLFYWEASGHSCSCSAASVHFSLGPWRNKDH